MVALSLTVYFDADCPLCRRVAAWLDAQPKFVPLCCVSAQGAADAAAAPCPVDPRTLIEQLTVTASDGAIYRGTKAWIMCLWALREYRGWAMTLSRESLWPLAERVFAGITGLKQWTKPAREQAP